MAIQGKKIAVVIPAYEAERTIADVLRGLPPIVDLIVVVDDGSPDDTSAVVRSLGDERIVLLRHERNMGAGAAVITGLKHALARGADIVVKMDADGQMRPEYLPDLVAPIIEGRCELAKGNRFRHRAELREMPPIRRFGNIALSLLTKVVAGYWHIFDSQNGYVAISREAATKLDLDALDTTHFFTNSLLIDLNIIGARVCDVDMPAVYGTERSSMRLSRIILSFPFKLLRGLVRRIVLKHCTKGLSAPGAMAAAGTALLASAVVLFLYRWAIQLPTGLPASGSLAHASGAALVAGLFLVALALILDIGTAAGRRHLPAIPRNLQPASTPPAAPEAQESETQARPPP